MMVSKKQIAKILSILIVVLVVGMFVCASGCTSVSKQSTAATPTKAPAPEFYVYHGGGLIQQVNGITYWSHGLSLKNNTGHDVKNVVVKLTLSDENGVLVGTVTETVAGPIKDKAEFGIPKTVKATKHDTEGLVPKYAFVTPKGVSNSPGVWTDNAEVLSYDIA